MHLLSVPRRPAGLVQRPTTLLTNVVVAVAAYSVARSLARLTTIAFHVSV